MLKFYNEQPESFTIVALNAVVSKCVFRENIEQVEDKWQCNEFYVVVPSTSTEAVEADMETYLVAAKENEEGKKKQEKIGNLTKQLNDSDYQVLKCAESFMLGAALPYDFSELLYERNAQRDTINGLEEEMTDEELLLAAKKRKITEMSAQSQFAIKNGIDYNEEHYSLNTHDQINLMSLSSLAQNGSKVPYHPDGGVCRIYEPDEFLGLVEAGVQWITYHTTYFNVLKHQILDLTTIDEVEEIEYGMELKEEYQTIINEIVGGE